jgi:hypothetical protein
MAFRSCFVFFFRSSSSHFTGLISPLVLHQWVPVQMPKTRLPSGKPNTHGLVGRGFWIINWALGSHFSSVVVARASTLFSTCRPDFCAHQSEAQGQVGPILDRFTIEKDHSTLSSVGSVTKKSQFASSGFGRSKSILPGRNL